ncbi:MAG TPA: response regulator transcription factor [Solirubrobacteraceae bacterium]|nr:response regulator transcription factor [Solirubrobacteraceae bacterium]
MRGRTGGNDTPGEIISLDWWASRRTGGDGTPAIRVLLADGAALVRAGLRALLEGEHGIKVVAEATRGDEAVALAIEMRPDVVLMDAALPGLDGLQATRRILAAPGLSDARVLILSEDGLDDDVFGALRAGATGFLVKDTDAAELVRAVRILAAGGAQLSPHATRRLLEELVSQPDPDRPVPEQLEELTAREREVMTLVALGLSNDEIAERLVVSPATAKTHVSRSMVKLHARDRAKLVALAYETGFVRPGPRETEARFAQPAHRAARVGLRSRRPGATVASTTAARVHGVSPDPRVGGLRVAGASVGLGRRVDHSV